MPKQEVKCSDFKLTRDEPMGSRHLLLRLDERAKFSVFRFTHMDADSQIE